MGKWYKEALKFLENDFTGKKAAVFISSSIKAGNQETYPQAIDQYLKKVLEKHPRVKPFATEAFGGRMKIAGHVTEDNRDVQKINRWALELGRSLCKIV